jgi:hypothetical protein
MIPWSSIQSFAVGSESGQSVFSIPVIITTSGPVRIPIGGTRDFVETVIDDLRERHQLYLSKTHPQQLQNP